MPVKASGGPVRPLADRSVQVYESPDPRKVFAYSPGILALPGGRLVATCDLGGPGVKELPGAKARRGTDFGLENQCLVFLSDNGGKKWRQAATLPMLHARPFLAGGRLFILGHAGDLAVARSDDQGETWTETARLTQGQHWHQAPCNVWLANGKVYLVMERRVRPGGWCDQLAPVLMSAREDSDLLRPESWTFANELSFADAVAGRAPGLLGVPFLPVGQLTPGNPKDVRDMQPPGWLESNVVQFVDPDHYWHDPTGRTFHLLLRAHTGSTNLACLAKVVEAEDGTLTTSLEKTPAGEEMLYLPCPGGQMKFHVLYDQITRLYWLLSTQATGSLTRADRLPDDRFNLPNNERRRLQLHFSKNCWDWCFAGLVAVGEAENASRHYASMDIDDKDLVILSRSGDTRASCAHNGNLITFHRVKNFRDLVY